MTDINGEILNGILSIQLVSKKYNSYGMTIMEDTHLHYLKILVLQKHSLFSLRNLHG